MNIPICPIIFSDDHLFTNTLGSGRDSFHNPHSHRFHRGAPSRESDEGLCYGSPEVALLNRYKFSGHTIRMSRRKQKSYMEKLSQPTSTKKRPTTAIF